MINKDLESEKHNVKNKDKEYYFKNRDKIRLKRKKFYQENRDMCLKRSKDWKQKNKLKVIEMSKNYYINNKKEKIKKVVEYQKIQYQTNINYKLKKILMSRIRSALKNTSKSKRTLLLLDIPNVEFLKNYLESKFKKGMTWENKHLWHIDHIKPCSSFDLTKPEEQAKCFHYTNLQPLWASENLAKGSKIS